MRSKINEVLFEVRSPQEKQILNFLLLHLEDIQDYTLNDVAVECYCSPTSITRIIKKLGYIGFSEYKSALRYDDKKHKTIQKSCASEKEIEIFAHELKKTTHLFIYGKGSSSLSAQYFFRQLIFKGYVVTWINEQDLLYYLNNKNLLILSNSGETNSVTDIARELIITGRCTIYTITRKNSQLYNLSNYPLAHLNDDDIIDRDDQVTLLITIQKILNYL